MRFGREGLVLGAGTVLAPAIGDGDLQIDGQEDRLQALLSAAYGRAPPAGAVGHVRRAAKCWNDGDAGRAELHLALTGLSRLEPAGNGPKRLFLADQLLRSGIAPNDICKALDIETPRGAPARKAFDPGELRNPKGDGVDSGRWTAEPGAGGQVNSLFERLTASQAWRLALYAARVAGPWAALGTVFIPTNKSLRVEGDVPGFPGMRYLWHSDGTRLYLNYTDPDGGFQTVVAQLDGKYFRDSKGRVIGMILPNNTLAINPAAAFNLKQKDEPKLCPKPKPDIPHGSKEIDLDFEDYIKAGLNPPPATPRGFGAWLPNPLATTGWQYYDDCQRATGILAEVKRGYTELLLWEISIGKVPLADQWLKQSQQQLAASEGRPIVWFFSERIPALFAQTIFDAKDQGRERIRVVYAPWKPGQK
jgi:hypothetical protein